MNDEGIVEGFVDSGVLGGVFNPDERRGGRSMLEVMGFKDEEEEKKRKRKREEFW